MTRRRCMWAAALGCAALVLCLAYWFHSRPHPVNEANFNRIQIGMTQAEVEAILGCPPGDYATDWWAADVLPHEIGRFESWASDWGVIQVYFDAHACVLTKHFHPLHQLSLIDRIHIWLGW